MTFLGFFDLRNYTIDSGNSGPAESMRIANTTREVTAVMVRYETKRSPFGVVLESDARANPPLILLRLLIPGRRDLEVPECGLLSPHDSECRKTLGREHVLEQS